MIVLRDLLETIKPFLPRREYIAITGPRQAGKTTLLKMLKTHLCNEMNISEDCIRIITFEDRILLSQFEIDPISFIQSYIPSELSGLFYFMIDEFQYAVDGGQKLKLIYDTHPNIKIFITGSSSLEIKAHVGKYMVGRILSFDLYPFNFREYLKAHDKRLERIYNKNNKLVTNWFSGGKECEIESGIDPFHQEIIKHYEQYCIW